MDLENRLKEIISAAPSRLPVLKAVQKCELNALIAGGFIRNAVWDAVYEKSEASTVNDIDVVYFKTLSTYGIPETDLMELIKRNEMNPVWAEEKLTEAVLKKAFPEFTFEVKNQARMHLSKARTLMLPAYASLEEAMIDWIETCTPVGLRFNASGELEVVAPHGLQDLFGGVVRPTRPEYEERLRERSTAKGWFDLWPNLKPGPPVTRTPE